ncbi:MAG TPA: cytochrome c oxidase accessory protein CcoG [Gammaproteobacteria bacterium]
MEQSTQGIQQHLDDLYEEAGYWHVNTGKETIHAKRVPGRFRNLKWLASCVWLVYLFGPYLRWGERQAVLFDIPNRQYHIFGATVLPQDFWMLSLLLLFFAILLAVVTATAGRVWCGYFCFQTVWTDLFTWIEEKFEGPPQARRQLDQAPLLAQLRVKLPKHLIWLLLGAFTGVSFIAWFTDAWAMWGQLFRLELPPVAYVTIAVYTAFTYVFAGHMREQVCFWLCPYARLQGVMYDKTTVLPTYDLERGEPRGRVRRGGAAQGAQGDCIDCRQCVAVCPTGIDIRHGQQEGCITCALCIDACNAVMDKVGRPRGLIRYSSLEELEGQRLPVLWQRPRVLVYALIMSLALAGIVYGLSTLSTLELNVLHERQPLFVLQRDGSVQNKYTLKVLNKTDAPLHVAIRAEGPPGLELNGADEPIRVDSGRVGTLAVYARVPRERLATELSAIAFEVTALERPEVLTRTESVFVGPR